MPLELRLEIIAYLIPVNETRMDLCCRYAPRRGLAVFHTCRKFYHEASDIYYARNTFCYGVLHHRRRSSRFVEALALFQRGLGQVQRLQIEMWSNNATRLEREHSLSCHHGLGMPPPQSVLKYESDHGRQLEELEFFLMVLVRAKGDYQLDSLLLLNHTDVRMTHAVDVREQWICCFVSEAAKPLVRGDITIEHQA